MMKKFLTALMILCLALPVSALALTRDEAVAIAQEAVGSDAAFVRAELDDGVYDVSFRTDTARFEVEVLDAAGAVLEIDTVFTDVPRATAFTLTGAEALAAAVQIAPEAENAIVTQERDDGACTYEIFYAVPGAIGEIVLNAETGAVASTKTFPEALVRGVLNGEDVARLVSERQEGAVIVELDLEWDDGMYQYSGEATVNNQRYSFDMNAITGKILEWERD